MTQRYDEASWSTIAIMPQAEMPCKGAGTCVWDDPKTLCSTCWARYYVLHADEIDDDDLIGEQDEPLAQQVLEEWEQDLIEDMSEDDLIDMALGGGWQGHWD